MVTILEPIFPYLDEEKHRTWSLTGGVEVPVLSVLLAKAW